VIDTLRMYEALKQSKP